MSMVNINRESLPDGFNAGNGTIGQTEGKVSSINLPINKHIVIRADAGNGSEEIIVGTPGNAANGFRLAAGEQTPPIFVNETDKVRVVATADNQDYSWVIS